MDILKIVMKVDIQKILLRYNVVTLIMSIFNDEKTLPSSNFSFLA